MLQLTLEGSSKRHLRRSRMPEKLVERKWQLFISCITFSRGRSYDGYFQIITCNSYPYSEVIMTILISSLVHKDIATEEVAKDREDGNSAEMVFVCLVFLYSLKHQSSKIMDVRREVGIPHSLRERKHEISPF